MGAQCFLLAMSLMTIASLVSADVQLADKVEGIHLRIRISDVQESSSLQDWKLRSRRLLQGDSSVRDRPAPRSFPPPQGNALGNNPRFAPPGRGFFDNDENAKPAPGIPAKPRPPPRP